MSTSKPVLVLLVMLLQFHLLAAQDCSTSALFKKGTVLTYQTQQKKFGPFSGNKFFELTRFVYTVTDVKDSNNTHYSYITKTGINPENEKQQYEIKYVLTCDGTTIHIPVYFYGVDTVFFSNMYPGSKGKDIYSATTTKSNLTYGYPLDVKKDKFILPNGQISFTGQVRVVQTGSDPRSDGFTQQLHVMKIEGSYTPKSVAVTGEETITTAAGSYPCLKVKMENESKGFPAGVNPGSGIFLYNAAIGIVRTEGYWKDKLLNYLELISIK